MEERELLPGGSGMEKDDESEEWGSTGFTGRRLARALAIEACYRNRLAAEDEEEAFSQASAREGADGELQHYGRALLKKAVEEERRIEALIAAAGSRWSPERFHLLDSVILQTAVAEMLLGEVSFRVAISEAVELAKQLSTEESGGFVNGVLDSIAAGLGLKEGG